MSDIANLFAGIDAYLPREQFKTLLQAAHVRIERIVSQGHVTPQGQWYDQAEHEWIIVLQGAAKLLFEDQPQIIEMKPGDCLNIAAHRRHRVVWTLPDQPTIWLAVFYSD